MLLTQFNQIVTKISQVLDKYWQLKRAYQKLTREKTILQNRLNDQQQYIQQLENEIKALKLLSGKQISETEKVQVKQTIAQLIAEIDNSIQNLK